LTAIPWHVVISDRKYILPRSDQANTSVASASRVQIRAQAKKSIGCVGEQAIGLNSRTGTEG